ncbi:uncharacterized protein At2g39795, mitochondrial [Dioscorea cayenensis subsp. rotundata]|uniref:Uncharacterized protein At2g39795, mitochondrial n=1 Tax=Dioscorea cayennensis subsp. rotundata TaxID=55577 RepID=A0AB40BL74_DIOCR|nr:uncharacterized protein At2g39795, mitochondrial [Dioscorea cayenensis subsp. rotundata]
MAFSAACRRASSAAVSVSLRALGTREIVRSSALSEPISMRSILSWRHAVGCPNTHSLARFSSLALKKPASDAGLLKVIDFEIKCAEESDHHDRVEEIPEAFPFQIQDDKGMNVITLKRTYQNENIEVVVSMPALVTGEEPENAGEGDNDDEHEKPSQSSLPLGVVMSKKGGPILEFNCTAYPDEVVIDSLSVREKEQAGEDSLAYEGPDFNDLDENLQKAFHKYLELRGVSALNTNFLHEYMINKDSREYLLWLRNLKKFIEK